MLGTTSRVGMQCFIISQRQLCGKLALTGELLEEQLLEKRGKVCVVCKDKLVAVGEKVEVDSFWEGEEENLLASIR